MPFRTEPLHEDFGVVIEGLDPARYADPEVVAFVREAIARHKLILVRNATLDATQQVGFARILGDIARRGPSIPATGTHSFVSNRVVGGQLPEGELYFHSDQTYFDPPLKALSLYAILVPSSGGDTLFTDATLAWERLPDETKATVSGLRAFHAHDYSGRKYARDTRGQIDLSRPDAVSATHPIVWEHPDLRRPVLLVNRSQTQHVVDLDPDEGRRLLEALYAHIEDPAHVYTHRWVPGDLLLWDNWGLQHARTEWPAGEGRTLRRVPIM
jgi:alpha-ketoglutarate-dependent taurine dioxygenase